MVLPLNNLWAMQGAQSLVQQQNSWGDFTQCCTLQITYWKGITFVCAIITRVVPSCVCPKSWSPELKLHSLQGKRCKKVGWDQDSPLEMPISVLVGEWWGNLAPELFNCLYQSILGGQPLNPDVFCITTLLMILSICSECLLRPQKPKCNIRATLFLLKTTKINIG